MTAEELDPIRVRCAVVTKEKAFDKFDYHKVVTYYHTDTPVLINEIDRLTSENRKLSGALQRIAEGGCEGEEDDVCISLLGYLRPDELCIPCQCQHALQTISKKEETCE